MSDPQRPEDLDPRAQTDDELERAEEEAEAAGDELEAADRAPQAVGTAVAAAPAAAEHKSPRGSRAERAAASQKRDSHARTTAGEEELPYVDDRVSKAWVILIAAVFGVILVYGLLFGKAGMFGPSTPTATPAISASPSPAATVTARPSTSPAATVTARPSTSPAATVTAQPSTSPAPSPSPAPSTPAASPATPGPT